MRLNDSALKDTDWRNETIIFDIFLCHSYNGNMARQDNVITAPHYHLTVPTWRDADVIIYPMLGQDALMGKHSWQLHQQRVMSSRLKFNRACRLSGHCWNHHPSFWNSIGHATKQPLLELSALHQAIAITGRYRLCDSIRLAFRGTALCLT